MNNFQEKISKISSNFFAVNGQSKRFLIGRNIKQHLFQELQEIQSECDEKKYELELLQNQRGINWIEIDIGIKIDVNIQSEDSLEIQKVVFSLWIGKNYPVRDIRLFCKTSFVKPSLADGRNLLHDVLQGNWSYKNNLVSIVKKLTQFIEKVLLYKSDSIYLQSLGQYYLGNFYFIDELKVFPELLRFPAIQMSSAFFPQVSVRLLCLSEAHFYMFEVADNNIQGKLRLVFRAPLQSCIQLKRKRDNSSEIIITWYNYRTKMEEQHVLKINEYDVFIRYFLRKLNSFPNIKMTSNSYLIFGDSQQSEKEKISDLIKQIFELEITIEKKFNLESINKLMQLYQSVIVKKQKNINYQGY